MAIQNKHRVETGQWGDILRDVVEKVLQRVDRTIVGNTGLQVCISPDGGSSASTNGDRIVIGEQVIQDFAAASDPLGDRPLLAVKGLNYHELGHVLFSPPVDVVAKHFNTYGYDGRRNHFLVMNILEDARIEMLFSLRYPAVLPYFVTNTTEIILNNSGKNPNARFLLTYGRRYLPAGLRRHIADNVRYSVEDKQKIATIFDEYLTLYDPQDRSRMYALVEALLKYLPAKVPDAPYSGGKRSGKRELKKQEREDLSKQVEKLEQQDQVRDELMAQSSLEDTAEPEGGSEDEAKTGAQGEEGNNALDTEESDSGDGEEDQEGDEGTHQEAGGAQGVDELDKEAEEEGGEKEDEDGDEAEDDDDEDEDDDDEDENENEDEGGGSSIDGSQGGETSSGQEISAGGQGAGTDDDDSYTPAEESILEQEAAAAVASVLDSPQVQSELTDFREDLQEAAANYTPTIGNVSVTAEMHEISHAIYRQLLLMKTGLKPGFVTRRKAGRLDIREVFRAESQQQVRTDMFKQYRQDAQREALLDVMLLIDRSGSMVSEDAIAIASQVSWIICNALRRIESPVEVQTFGSWDNVEKERDVRFDSQLYTQFTARGGTLIAGALHKCLQYVSTSKPKNPAVIVITDGQFGDRVGADDRLQELKKLGAFVAQIGIGTSNDGPWNASVQVSSVRQLPVEMRKIIVHIQRWACLRARAAVS